MNKKAPILFLAIIFSSLIYAGDTVQVKSLNRVYLGISFTPGVSYRILSHNYFNSSPPPQGFTNEQVEKTILDSRRKYEKPAFAYSCGVTIGINITRYLAIETGVEYSSLAYQTKRNDLMFADGFLPNLTYDSTKLGSLVATSGYHYLNIPVALNFSLGQKKVKAIINTGANINVLVGQWSTTVWESSYEGKHSGKRSTSGNGQFNGFNFSPFLGVGIDYHINNFIVLRIMPTAQIQALKNIDTPITEHLWSAGINTSLLFGFKKIK